MSRTSFKQQLMKEQLMEQERREQLQQRQHRSHHHLLNSNRKSAHSSSKSRQHSHGLATELRVQHHTQPQLPQPMDAEQHHQIPPASSYDVPPRNSDSDSGNATPSSSSKSSSGGSSQLISSGCPRVDSLQQFNSQMPTPSEASPATDPHWLSNGVLHANRINSPQSLPSFAVMSTELGGTIQPPQQNMVAEDATAVHQSGTPALNNTHQPFVTGSIDLSAPLEKQLFQHQQLLQHQQNQNQQTTVANLRRSASIETQNTHQFASPFVATGNRFLHHHHQQQHDPQRILQHPLSISTSKIDHHHLLDPSRTSESIGSEQHSPSPHGSYRNSISADPQLGSHLMLGSAENQAGQTSAPSSLRLLPQSLNNQLSSPSTMSPDADDQISDEPTPVQSNNKDSMAESWSLPEGRPVNQQQAFSYGHLSSAQLCYQQSANNQIQNATQHSYYTNTNQQLQPNSFQPVNAYYKFKLPASNHFRPSESPRQEETPIGTPQSNAPVEGYSNVVQLDSSNQKLTSVDLNRQQHDNQNAMDVVDIRGASGLQHFCSMNQDLVTSNTDDNTFQNFPQQLQQQQQQQNRQVYQLCTKDGLVFEQQHESPNSYSSLSTPTSILLHEAPTQVMQQLSSSYPARTELGPNIKLISKERQKKDNHNQIERKRRHNINDRIKELSSLLPNNNDDSKYQSVVKDLKQHKGNILRASVEYVHLLKNEVHRLERRQQDLEAMNSNMKKKLQELELVQNMMQKLNK